MNAHRKPLGEAKVMNFLYPIYTFLFIYLHISVILSENISLPLYRLSTNRNRSLDQVLNISIQEPEKLNPHELRQSLVHLL